MYPKYQIEGCICFMTVAPYLEPVFEVYDMEPNGAVRYIINQRPKYVDFTNLSGDKMNQSEEQKKLSEHYSKLVERNRKLVDENELLRAALMEIKEMSASRGRDYSFNDIAEKATASLEGKQW